MELFVLGTSHSVASAHVRERMQIELDEALGVLQQLTGRGVLDEAIPLTTCGRWEVYCVAPNADRAARILRTLVAQKTGISPQELKARSYVYHGHDAVRHLLGVASGLDSVVHGEAQILGQVRDALGHPAIKTEGPILHRLFQRAISAGKRVRTETEIGRGAASLAGASLSLLRREAGPLKSLSVLVLGAGDTGALMARLLTKAGVGSLVIANRTFEHARSLALELGAQAAEFTDLPQLLGTADVVVGAVAASHRLVTPEMLRSGGQCDSDRNKYFADLAHPRNFDPTIGDIDGVRLFDLEHISERVEKVRAVRAAQVPQAEAIVAEEGAAFRRWVLSRRGVSVLKAVRGQVFGLAEAEAARHGRGRTEEERDLMKRFARSLARTILHSPTVALRGVDPSSEEGRSLLKDAAVLFGVDDLESDAGELL